MPLLLLITPPPSLSPCPTITLTCVVWVHAILTCIVPEECLTCSLHSFLVAISFIVFGKFVSFFIIYLFILLFIYYYFYFYFTYFGGMWGGSGGGEGEVYSTQDVFWLYDKCLDE